MVEDFYDTGKEYSQGMVILLIYGNKMYRAHGDYAEK